jgi:peptidoglycan/LPS O-acetylase OafA/YrhL
LKYIPNRGHDFVILFFVLSGYVIAATVDRKRSHGLREYTLDRLARVYSVAIPALILSSILLIVFGINGHEQETSYPKEILNLLVNIPFLGQIWWEMNLPFQNGPYWSLCYEAMYYVAFGLFTYLKGAKKWISLFLFSIFIGPKILILMPCWALGAMAYYSRDKIKLKTSTALFFAAIFPIIIAVSLHSYEFGIKVRNWIPDITGNYYSLLGFSDYFVADYVTAMIVAINIYAMRYVRIKWPQNLQALIKNGASMSFTLYLMHMPFIFLILRFTERDERGYLIFFTGTVGVLYVCHLISKFTEVRKNQLREWLDKKIPRPVIGSNTNL